MHAADVRNRSHLIRLGSASALALLGGCGSSGPIDGAAAMRHVEAICAIGPRPFGSPELGKAADYICAELTKLGLQPKRQEETDEQEHKLIRNLYVQIDGPDPQSGPIVMIGAHYDTKLTQGQNDPARNFRFVGAIDGTGAPAVLLELARVLKTRPERPKVNMWLYWIDAEESIDWAWNKERSLLGSKAFCKWLAANKLMERVKAFVLLDLIGDRNIKIDRDGASSGPLQQIIEKAGAAMGESQRVYKYQSTFTDDHETFSLRGIPSVLLIDFQHRVGLVRWKEMAADQPMPDPEGYAQWWHTDQDTPDKMSAASLAFAGDLVLQALPAFEEFALKKRP
jgi:Zn-dependent M28 family amino/carboxypeptidase